MNNPYKGYYDWCMNQINWKDREKQFEDFDNPGTLDVTDLLDARRILVQQYAWAVPTEKAVKTIVDHSPVIEIGAGNGYWAWLIKQVGGNIKAYDKYADDCNQYDEQSKFFPVKQGTHKKVKRHNDRALLLCWPTYSSGWAAECLDLYDGDTVIYIGEGKGGCTADRSFHQKLKQGWNFKDVINIPQWYGIHDRMHIFTR